MGELPFARGTAAALHKNALHTLVLYKTSVRTSQPSILLGAATAQAPEEARVHPFHHRRKLGRIGAAAG